MLSTRNGGQDWPHPEGGNFSKRLTSWICQPYQQVNSLTGQLITKRSLICWTFSITRGISKNSCSTESCLDLASDHSPLIIILTSKVITKSRSCTLHNAKTDWSYFQELLTTSLNNSISLKTENDIICAVENFNHEVQQAAWNATPVCKSTNTNFEYSSAS